MKRCFKLGAMAVACAAGVMVSAGAANFTSSADRLHEVGLFQGTGTTASGAPQYDLDRAPTRAEAAVMLVRLLGKEADAKALTYTGALDFAADNVGLIDESFCDTNNFLRDNVAAMSLEALATPVKATAAPSRFSVLSITSCRRRRMSRSPQRSPVHTLKNTHSSNSPA